jgi:hypothetical protein
MPERKGAFLNLYDGNGYSPAVMAVTADVLLFLLSYLIYPSNTCSDISD